MTTSLIGKPRQLYLTFSASFAAFVWFRSSSSSNIFPADGCSRSSACNWSSGVARPKRRLGGNTGFQSWWDIQSSEAKVTEIGSLMLDSSLNVVRGYAARSTRGRNPLCLLLVLLPIDRYWAAAIQYGTDGQKQMFSVEYCERSSGLSECHMDRYMGKLWIPFMRT